MLNIILGLGYFSNRNETIQKIKKQNLSAKTVTNSGMLETQTVSTTMAAAEAVNKTLTVPTEVNPKTPKGSHVVMDATAPFTDEELRSANEKVLQEREEYLKTELQLTEAQIGQWEKLKIENFKKVDQLFRNNKNSWYDFKSRRHAINLEENLHLQGSQVFGQKKWKDYLSFTESYNRNAMKNRDANDFGPVVFMEL